MELFKLLGTIAIDNSEAKDALKETTDHAKKTGEGLEDTKNKAESSGSGMGAAFKKVGAAVVTYLSVDAIKDFGLGCVQAAADAQAMESQFTQVFGELEGNASKSLSGIADEAGISENRMKGSFTKIAAFAKTTGMDTESALTLSERAMIAVADSAAFYDRSLEDTTESLQSFLKGNFENDAALGLSCTETTRNAAANELYGKSFKDLSESQKQLTLLQMVEDANKTSGALGQAARESDTWTNQTGNLKQAWTDFQAVLGANILPKAVEIVKKFAGVIQNLSDKVPAMVEKFDNFRQKASDIGDYISATLKPIFDDLKAAFDKISDAISPIIESFKEYVTSGEAADDITNAIKASIDLLATAYQTVKDFVIDVVNGFKDAVEWGKQHETAVQMIAIAIGTLTTAIVAYNVAQAIKNAGGIAELAQLALLQVQLWGLTAAQAAQTVATTVATTATSAFGAVMSFVTSPITLVIVAIGALIAIGVLLYKNWDVIKEKALEIFENVKNTFNNLKQALSIIVDAIKTLVAAKIKEMKNNITKVMNSIKNTFTKVWNAIKTVFTTVWSAIKSIVTKYINNVKNNITRVFNAIKSVITTVMNAIKSVVTKVWNAIKSTITNVMNSIKTKISTVFNAVKTIVSNAINNVKSKISSGLTSAKNTVSNVLNSIKSKFSSIFDSAKEIVSKAIEKIKGFLDFDWSLPKLKLPHFSISGSFSLDPPSVPSFGIDWYAKAMNNAMVLENPTIFGYDAGTRQFMGGGEAGAEVVAGANTLMGMISNAVSGQNSELKNVLYKILAAILSLDANMGGNMREALAGTSFEVNNREFARLVKAVK